MEEQNISLEGFDLKPENLDLIIKAGVDINSCFLLYWYNQEIDVTEYTSASKVLSWRQLLLRNRYLNENNTLTDLGKQLIDSLKGNVEEFIKIKKAAIKAIPITANTFESWWEIFPSTDKFEYKGKLFELTRGLRTDKKKSKAKWDEIISKQRYSAEQIIKGTSVDILTRKENSIKTGKNNLTFMHNSATYLNQEDFEPFIGEEPVEQKEKVEDTGFRGTLI